MRIVQSQHSPRFRSVKYKLSKQSIFQNGIGSFRGRGGSVQRMQKNIFKKNKILQLKSTYLNLSLVDTSILNCQSPYQQKMRKSTYLQTFNYLLNIQKNKYNTKQKEQQQKKKQIENIPIPSIKLPRVSLPTLNQLDSYFTVLDNIHIPITYITNGIQKIKKQIQVQVQNLKKIAVQIGEVGKKYENDLIEVQQKGVKQFQRLRSMLRSNKIYQQQQVLKLKSSFEKTKNYLPEYYKQLDSNKRRVIEIQSTIFTNTPFELKQNEEFQQLSTQYF